MTKNKYKLRHIACNMADFHADRHRFRFYYNNAEYIAECYGASMIYFCDKANANLPENVLCEIQQMIWHKIDTEEHNWHYPEEAYIIVNSSIKEE